MTCVRPCGTAGCCYPGRARFFTASRHQSRMGETWRRCVPDVCGMRPEQTGLSHGFISTTFPGWRERASNTGRHALYMKETGILSGSTDRTVYRECRFPSTADRLGEDLPADCPVRGEVAGCSGFDVTLFALMVRCWTAVVWIGNPDRHSGQGCSSLFFTLPLSSAMSRSIFVSVLCALPRADAAFL